MRQQGSCGAGFGHFFTLPYLYSLVEELVKFSRDLGTTS